VSSCEIAGMMPQGRLSKVSEAGDGFSHFSDVFVCMKNDFPALKGLT
jgi:hypothetical protein